MSKHLALKHSLVLWIILGLLSSCTQSQPLSPSTSLAQVQSTAPSPTLSTSTASPLSSPTLIATKIATAEPATATATLQLFPTPIPATAIPPKPIPPTVIPPKPIPPTAKPQPILSHLFPIYPANIAEFGSCHHDYPASDIFVPTGSSFVAVTSGVVEYVTYEDVWDPNTDEPAVRGGISVAMIGDDGVRYYGSHLSAVADGIAVGVRVNAGDVLGYTGNSGSARPTPPHLHFGISPPTTPDDWSIRRGTINPYPYLLRWLDGENVTPNLNDPPSGAC